MDAKLLVLNGGDKWNIMICGVLRSEMINAMNELVLNLL